ncbi:MAG: phenylacetic acid degradation bifunctional protein PaaZ [Saprospiraceae bacterium]
MPQLLQNYVLGQWQDPTGNHLAQTDAVTGELIGHCSTEGLDFGDILAYARSTAGPVLRRMTFQERGLMLKKLALFLHDRRKDYYALSYRTGATKRDSWVDIEGGIGTLFAYASLRRQLGDQPFYVEGDVAKISKEGTFVGQHISVPRQGVAVHINAFNFPIWGMLEKISVNLLAGMPAVVKPSEVTSFLTEAMVRDIVGSGILPAGALQLVQGSGRGVLEATMSQDVVTFTGSAATGQKLKALPHLIAESVPFNMEADSLNAAVLAPDAEPGTEEFDLFIKEVKREMIGKAGQKCTAIRRVIVPERLVEDVQIELGRALGRTRVGAPTAEGVHMGALVGQTQRDRVREQLRELQTAAELVYGSPDTAEVLEADYQKGAFLSPLLLRADDPLGCSQPHEVEAFGPVATLLPYSDLDQAWELVRRGRGSLVTTVCTGSDDTARRAVMEIGAYNGRMLLLNRASAPESTGHGSPLPLLNHGGPGRAGGGQEMGGMRGIHHYLQSCAVQGHPTMLSRVGQRYLPGGARPESAVHPFRLPFEELEIGQTLTTARHTVTEADIVNFANLTGDRFYAHVDETSLEGTPFERRVAHGYYILSKAAGLFVEPRKGPVLLNYGLETCRFTKPVYPGMTIGVQLTVQEKVTQQKREDEDYYKGIVKWYVETTDETGETVAVATILTMVRRAPDEN